MCIVFFNFLKFRLDYNADLRIALMRTRNIPMTRKVVEDIRAREKVRGERGEGERGGREGRARREGERGGREGRARGAREEGERGGAN